MKTALIVAFHFPPYGAGSGILRILKFCRYLPEFGWQPVVLSAHTRAYERINPASLRDIPAGTPVTRALALDTQRHLSIKGRYYAGWFSDRWFRGCSAIAEGSTIRKNRADVIITTYPIATAVLITLCCTSYRETLGSRFP
jgi:hypothetical protein